MPRSLALTRIEMRALFRAWRSMFPSKRLNSLGKVTAFSIATTFYSLETFVVKGNKNFLWKRPCSRPGIPTLRNNKTLFCQNLTSAGKRRRGRRQPAQPPSQSARCFSIQSRNRRPGNVYPTTPRLPCAPALAQTKWLKTWEEKRVVMSTQTTSRLGTQIQIRIGIST